MDIHNQTNLSKTPSELLEEACVSRFGIEITLSSPELAIKMRRKLYAHAAAKCPLHSIGISALLRGSTIRLIKRNNIGRKNKILIEKLRPLSPDDLPTIIRARGPSKFVFHRNS